MTALPTSPLAHARVVFCGSSSVEPTSPLPPALAAELGLAGDWRALGVRSSRLRDWTTPPWPAGLTADAIVVLLTGNDAHPRADAVARVDQALHRHALGRRLAPSPALPLRLARGGAGPADARRARGGARRARGDERSPRVERLGARSGAPDARRIPLLRAPGRARAPYGALACGSRRSARRARPSGRSSPRAARTFRSRARTRFGWRALLTGEGGGEADAQAITSTMLRRLALLWDSGNRHFHSLADLVVGRFQGPTAVRRGQRRRGAARLLAAGRRPVAERERRARRAPASRFARSPGTRSSPGAGRPSFG